MATKKEEKKPSIEEAFSEIENKEYRLKIT